MLFLSISNDTVNRVVLSMCQTLLERAIANGRSVRPSICLSHL